MPRRRGRSVGHPPVQGVEVAAWIPAHVRARPRHPPVQGEEVAARVVRGRAAHLSGWLRACRCGNFLWLQKYETLLARLAAPPTCSDCQRSFGDARVVYWNGDAGRIEDDSDGVRASAQEASVGAPTVPQSVDGGPGPGHLSPRVKEERDTGSSNTSSASASSREGSVNPAPSPGEAAAEVDHARVHRRRQLESLFGLRDAMRFEEYFDEGEAQAPSQRAAAAAASSSRPPVPVTPRPKASLGIRTRSRSRRGRRPAADSSEREVLRRVVRQVTRSAVHSVFRELRRHDSGRGARDAPRS